MWQSNSGGGGNGADPFARGHREGTFGAFIDRTAVAVQGLLSRRLQRRKSSPQKVNTADIRAGNTRDRSTLDPCITLGDYMQALVDEHNILRREY